MSTTVEVHLGEKAGAEEIERALSALGAGGAWALELLDRARAAVVLALSPEPSAERARAAAEDALARARVPAERVVARASRSAEWSPGWDDRAGALGVGPLWIGAPGRAPAGASRYLAIDAKTSFGTGRHETTSLCLERILELSPIESLLDIGTGSGVLSLAALALGGGRAVGTDRDPDALAAAAVNAERNRLADRLRLTAEMPDAIGERFPVVFANVIALTLIELAPHIVRALASPGLLVLSGVRTHEIDDVAVAYEALGLVRGSVEARGHWVRLELATASWVG